MPAGVHTFTKRFECSNVPAINVKRESCFFEGTEHRRESGRARSLIQEGNRTPESKATHSRYREGPVRPASIQLLRHSSFCVASRIPERMCV